MKTDKFDKNIRQKLERISPNFEEKDWGAMQDYMKAQSPPSLWQQYRGWSGYAAAASVVLLSALLYAGQLQKNRELVSAVASLEEQMQRMQSTIPPVSSTLAVPDTVYIVQKEYITLPSTASDSRQYDRLASRSSQRLTDQLDQEGPDHQPVPYDHSTANNSQKDTQEGLNGNKKPEFIADIPQAQETAASNKMDLAMNQEPAAELDAVGLERTELAYFPDPITSENSIQRTEGRQLTGSDFRMEYALKSRISPTRINSSLGLSGTTNIHKQANAKEANPTNRKADGKSETLRPDATVKAGGERIAGKKETNASTRPEQVIPDLPIKSPYRFGLGYGWEGSSHVKSIVADVQVSKRFSLTTGLSWLKAKPMEFINEKMFKERIRSDFKKEHYDKIPQALEVVNIRVQPTTLQIPLTLAFRSNLAKDLDYYLMGGGQITVSAKDRFDYNMVTPGSGFNNDYYQTGFTKNKKLPLINTINIGVGIEKSWHPVVVQIEGYYFQYFNPMIPGTSKSGPALRLKLLYQIGKDA